MSKKFTSTDILEMLEPELSEIEREVFSTLDALIAQIEDKGLRSQIYQETDKISWQYQSRVLPMAFMLGLQFGTNPAELFDL